jgi:diguanylate cyclase (GGDEF)-like protein/PAS domain S-box-containing protein
MTGWLLESPGPLHLAYGLAFFMLGVAALAFPRYGDDRPLGGELWLLAAFGFLRGLLEFVEWAGPVREPPWIASAGGVLGVLSYLPLLEFGRRLLMRGSAPRHLSPLALHGAGLACTAAFAGLAVDPVFGLAIGARLFVGAPSALLAGLAFFALAHETDHRTEDVRSVRYGFGLVALAFFAYGAVMLLVTLPVADAGFRTLTADALRAAAGWPARFVYASCAGGAGIVLFMLARDVQVRRSENMERLFDTLHGVVYRRVDGRAGAALILAGNVEELTGYPRAAFFGRAPLTLGALVHPDDAARMRDEVDSALAGRRGYELSYRILTRMGDVRWVFERGHGVHAADGTLRYREGHLTDVTGQIEANEVLRLKEAAIESSINGVVMLGPNGRIFYVNPAFVEMWRLKNRKDALERPPTDFFESAEAVRRGVDAQRRSGSWRGELCARRADGTAMNVQAVAYTVFDEHRQPLCLMASFTDISERVDAQRALEESARRLAEAQAMAHLGSWDWDLATGEFRGSDELHRIYGFDPAGGPRDFTHFILLVHPQDRERVVTRFHRAAERCETFEIEYRIVRPDGTERIVTARARTECAEDGRPVKVFGMAQDITERAELLARLTKIGRNAPGVIYQYQLRADGSSCFPYASEGLREICGVPPEDVVADASAVMTLLHPDDRAALIESIERSAATQQIWHESFRVDHPDRGVIWVEGRATPERLADGSVFWHGMLLDISEQKRIEAELASRMEELRQSEARQRELVVLAQREQSRLVTLLSGMSIGILFEDRGNRVEYVNPAFRHMWAIGESADLIGQPTREVLDHSTHRFARPDHASKHVLHVLDTHEISERFEIDLYDGRVLTQLSYPVSDIDGRTIGRLWIYEDVTHERQTAQQLIYLAEHDALTGLYNRRRFQDQLERLIGVSARSGARFALLYFDLDDFKTINDTFGHRAGDTVLVRAAGEVASLVRGGELFARLGGDEFAILLETTRDDDAIELADRIVHAISAIPFRLRGSNLRLTTSIGITLFPQHGDNAEDLVAHADTAMYQAKDSGKNTWAIYDPTRNVAEAMLERMTWSSRIAQAIAQNGLELHFQGIYRTHDRSLSHLEALVRMKDPADPERLIMPGQFIPIAEKNGQILEIDRWVIRQSIALLQDRPDLPALAINISGRSFDEPGLAHYIQQHLAHHGVDPRRLIIELTETAAVSEMQDAQRFIEALQQTGCLICLDDFGAGFSTFAYLKYLNAHILKIDGMFVRDLPNNRENQAFVKAMIDVARGLDKVTIAEFVEDAATFGMLRSFGVDMAQGYHLDRPSPQLPGAG